MDIISASWRKNVLDVIEGVDVCGKLYLQKMPDATSSPVIIERRFWYFDLWWLVVWLLLLLCIFGFFATALAGIRGKLDVWRLCGCLNQGISWYVFIVFIGGKV